MTWRESTAALRVVQGHPARRRPGGLARCRPAEPTLLLACVAALLGCELGSEPPARTRPDAVEPNEGAVARVSGSTARTSPDAPPASVEPAAAGDEPAAAAHPAPEEASSAEVESRLDAILDADPEGDGLDLLVQAATEDASPSHRAAAIAALGDSSDPRALDALIAATEDADPSVALAALEELRWSDDRLAQDAILRLVDSPDPAVAAAAQAASEAFE